MKFESIIFSRMYLQSIFLEGGMLLDQEYPREAFSAAVSYGGDGLTLVSAHRNTAVHAAPPDVPV